MTDEEKEICQRLKDNLEHYALKCLKIRTKSGSIEPFIFNRAQEHLHKKIQEQKGRLGYVRKIVLKGRQQGCSSYISGRYYHLTTHNFGFQTFILTHLGEATNNLFEMAYRFWENTPQLVRPMVSTNNSKSLVFGTLDSGYKIGTAENKSVGRSATIQLFHGSEVAFWQNAEEHAKGILQAVPDAPGTEIILESTANGVGNYFHQMWQKAEAGLSDFEAVFIPWFWQEEYQREPEPDFSLTVKEQELQSAYSLTNAQLCWRRYKIINMSINGQDGEKSFAQEYPCNANEAFQLTGENTFIDSTIVMRARKCETEGYGPVLIGVDPARFGDDRTSILFRQGRKVYNLESYTKKDTMEVTGIVHQLMLKHQPAKVFVDVGGLGAGVVDRLKELWPGDDRIVAVNAGSSPLDKDKYSNKRAEMWGLVKNWFFETPCQIPDEDSLHADLCGIRYRYNSNTQLVMESKDEMKKRGIRSCDEADALALTFALPAQSLMGERTNPMLDTFIKDFQNKSHAMSKSRGY